MNKICYNEFVLICQPGGMVDAVDSKSTDSDIIRVQVPWLVPK